jgi:peptidoglycan/xylan/chitin deacetylase (PgdA/CDA1 family)
MTHDVETEVGYKFCSKIIQIERAFDIKSSFEIVPERRYQVTSAFLDEIREDGREICLHGLNHDGRLFNSETEFRERAKKINEYAAKYAAIGFRSPVMYRRLDWYDAFEFSFDMSVPNVAHLDPQQGGCCTVMPYFIGRILELPLTTTQDYSLYHILGEYSLDLWRQQIELILSRHGLISFIIHPDYTIPQRVQNLYKSLLELLARLGSDHHVWLALPRDVDAWLRQRKQMELVKEAGRWVIRGLHAQRARVAYATVEDWGMKYEVQPEPTIAQEV